MPSKRSKVWLHVAQVNKDCAKCNTCGLEIACRGGNTSNISTHLKRHHGIDVSSRADMSVDQASGIVIFLLPPLYFMPRSVL